MQSLDIHPTTLPYILARSRDVDPINRRLLYAHSLSQLPSLSNLALQQRNAVVKIVVKSGLHDREDAVKKAAGKLVSKWAGELEGGILEVS
jgi:condensin complex subunit 3